MKSFPNHLQRIATTIFLLWHLTVYSFGQMKLSQTMQRTFYPPAQPKALYFSGAGIYFFWQAGCARYIQENCDCSDLPIIGASAGSLSAALLLSDIDFVQAAQVALRIGEEAKVYDRKAGLAGIWGSLLYTWLNEIMPDSVSQETFKRLQIAVTPYLSTPKLVGGFVSKKDVIEACMASCHVPVFLDGRPTTSFRGEAVLDGSFWYFVTKDRTTGLPIPRDLKPEEIFWIDYCDDLDFMQSISGNILELASPTKILDMMDDGYNFMKREHYCGRLPMARNQKPSFVYISEAIDAIEMIPRRLRDWGEKIQAFKYAAAAAAATAAENIISNNYAEW